MRNRIHKGATGLMGFMGFFLIYFLWTNQGSMIEFAFTKPELWEGLEWVDQGITVPLPTRVLWYGLWSIETLIAVTGFGLGFHLLWLYRSGSYFSSKTFHTIFRIGLVLIALVLYSSAVRSINFSILQMYNADFVFKFRNPLSNMTIGYFVLGCGFCLIGWVQSEALKMQDELEGFL